MISISEHRRAAFTILEMLVALAIMAVVLVLVAETVTWCARERVRLSARFAALQQAENVLSTAAATTSANLTEAWAKERKLGPTGDLPDDARLSVRVEAEPADSKLKRVTVEVAWVDGATTQTVALVGVFGPRPLTREGSVR